MGKRLITVLVTVFTVMLLTGCNADNKAVTQAAEGFLNAMVNNDMQAAAQYATEDFMKSETMKMMDPEYLADSFYAAMNVDKEDLDEQAQNAVNEYVKKVVEKAYKSFEIQDVKIQESSAAVTTKITLGYNPESSSVVSDEMVELVGDYQTEHYDELIEIYTEEGEVAMNKKIYNDLIPIVIGKMQEALENSSTSEEKTVLTLAKQDGKWLVTALEENRPGADTGAAAEESAAAVSTAQDAEHAADAESASEEAASEESTSEEASEERTSEESASEESASEENAQEGSTEGETSGTAGTKEETAG